MNFVQKNYTNKIRKIIPKNYTTYNINETSVAVNELINFFNYCFLMRNGFFIENFNKRQLHCICEAYNKMKTNIIVNGNNTVFDRLSESEIRQFKFIINKNINNKIYEKFEWLTKNGLQICLDLLSCAYYASQK